MPSIILPAAVQAAFYIAGVLPVFIAELDREAWLSTSVKVGGRTLLIIDAEVNPDRLATIADECITAMADRCQVD